MNQVLPYLPYTPADENLRNLIAGLINRQSHSVLIDPFANAFNFNASSDGHKSDSTTPPMTPWVFESKYEIDSLGAFMKLSYWFYHYNSMSLDEMMTIYDETWLRAVQSTVSTIELMRTDRGNTASPPYRFQRMTTQATDTLMLSGRGPPAGGTGLSRSLFRPSDDAVTLPYNIPGALLLAYPPRFICCRKCHGLC